MSDLYDLAGLLLILLVAMPAGFLALRYGLRRRRERNRAECGFDEPHAPHEYVVGWRGKPVEQACPGLRWYK